MHAHHFRVSLFLFLVMISGCSAVKESIHSPQRIVFFGDSITQLGENPGGYVRLVRDSLLRRTPLEGSTVINAGISGNKVSDLLKRMQRDVLAKEPSIVVIYIGINDVWHYALPKHTGTPRDSFALGLKTMISAIRSAGARVILCTPSVIGEKIDGTNPQDAMLDEYSGISRAVAKEMDVPLCDLRMYFLENLRNRNSSNAEKGILTTDRVHLNAAGNAFVADKMVQAILEVR
jgi:lysophospholipase L1-like esterase